jgi:hypothetical protein
LGISMVINYLNESGFIVEDLTMGEMIISVSRKVAASCSRTKHDCEPMAVCLRAVEGPLVCHVHKWRLEVGPAESPMVQLLVQSVFAVPETLNMGEQEWLHFRFSRLRVEIR